ncbi:MAG: 2Fe-2S iron-sulfur cluster-binding protein [Marinilabiliales bacterium]|nr:2Fe-2S iron-sulfur cluster-binding protein [Marinilabiliales bacterium]
MTGILVVSPGSNLLTTLSGNGIFLPSACGGGGTCGMCKCQITRRRRIDTSDRNRILYTKGTA